MSAPTLICAIDETPASAAVIAALIGLTSTTLATQLSLVTEHDGPDHRRRTLERLTKSCARRGLAVELDGDAIAIGDRRVALEPTNRRTPPATGPLAALRDGRVELGLDSGERAELLAAAPLLEGFERGPGFRWGLLGVIDGRDHWSASVDLCEHQPEWSLDAALQRWFPKLVGRVGHTHAIGPQLGSALHMSVLLGSGTSVDSVRDLLAAQAEDRRSRWPRLRARSGFGSADCLGDPGVAVDLDAIASAGPLVRVTAYFDPPTLLAADLLARFMRVER